MNHKEKFRTWLKEVYKGGGKLLPSVVDTYVDNYMPKNIQLVGESEDNFYSKKITQIRIVQLLDKFNLKKGEGHKKTKDDYTVAFNHYLDYLRYEISTAHTENQTQ